AQRVNRRGEHTLWVRAGAADDLAALLDGSSEQWLTLLAIIPNRQKDALFRLDKLFDQNALHTLACDHSAQEHLRLKKGFVRHKCGQNATLQTASAHMYLCLDDHRGAHAFCEGLDLMRIRRDKALWDRDAVLLEQQLGLIFIQLHALQHF